MAHPHRGQPGPARARVQRPGGRPAGALPRPVSRPWATTSPTVDRRRAGSPARRRSRLPAPALRARLRGDATATPSTAATGTRAGWRVDRLRRRRAAPGLDRRRGDRPVADLDCRRRHRRLRARRRDGGRRAHRRRVVGHRPREGPQPPARPRAAVRPDGRLLQRRDQVRPAATSSGPTRCSSRARYRRSDADGDRLLTGRREQPAVDGRRRRRPRRRQAAPLPGGGLPPAAARGARSTAPTSPTGRSTTTTSSRYYAEAERLDRRRRRGRRQPVRGVALRPVPDAARAGHVRRRAVGGGRRAARACTRTGRRPGSTASPYDGRPACNNCGFCGGYGCPIHAKGDPVASLRRALRTGRCELRPGGVRHRGGPRRGRAARHRRPLPRRATGDGRTRCGPATWSWPPAPSRRPGCCCATASATRRTWSAATSRTTSRRSRSAASRTPLHGERGRAVTHLHDDLIVATARTQRRRRPGRRAAVDPGRDRRARRRDPARSRRRCTYPPGPQHTPVDAGLARCATGCGSSPCRARTSRRPPTGSTSIPPVRDAWGFPAGRVTYAPHRHELVASAHWAPGPRGGHARRRRRLVLLQHLAADRRGRPAGEQPARAGPRLQARHGHLPDGQRPGHQRGRPRAAVSTTSRTCSCADSSVFVTVGGLQPDAHHRRPRPPGGVAARRHPAAGHRTRLTGEPGHPGRSLSRH